MTPWDIIGLVILAIIVCEIIIGAESERWN
jgi:hypothetical protein